MHARRGRIQHGFRTLVGLIPGFFLFPLLRLRSRSALAAENLFLRKQLGLFQELKVKPRRPDDSTRWLMAAALSRLFNWREALVVVKPETIIRLHRKGFRLFWRY
jgi:putative transposase